MLNGEKYFDSFPDEKPTALEHGKDPKTPIGLTAELHAALEELSQYFQQFLSKAAE